jgi:cbb3-type cytochrome c oxidase subunit III
MALRVVNLTVTVGGALLVAGYIQEPIRAARQDAAALHADASAAKDPGAESYAKHCAICHGEQREGILPWFPPLAGISHQMTDDKIADLVHSGKGRMPGFPNLRDGELSALLHFVTSAGTASPSVASGTKDSGAPDLVESGSAVFQGNCAFCHGPDATGGEAGPDLTKSKIVLADKTGEAIAQVVREGRPGKMPGFTLSDQEMLGVIAFIRAREADALTHPGVRRGAGS